MPTLSTHAKPPVVDTGGNAHSQTAEEGELTPALLPVVDVHAVTGCPFPAQVSVGPQIFSGL